MKITEKTRKPILLATIIMAALMMTTTAAAISSVDSPDHQGVSEQSWAERNLPNIGFFDITSAQNVDGDLQENTVVVEEGYTDFQATEMCTANTGLGDRLGFWSSDSVENVGVIFYIEPGDDLSGGSEEVVIAKEAGFLDQVSSGECYNVMMNGVWIPESAMSAGAGEYEFRARFFTVDDGDTMLINGEPDTGTIELLGNLEGSEDPKGEIYIEGTEREHLGDRGYRDVVESGDTITFGLEDKQGTENMGELDWKLRDLEDAPDSMPVVRRWDGTSHFNEQEFTFNDGTEGSYSVGVTINHAFRSYTHSTSQSFYVRNPDTPAPTADVYASDRTVTEGDSVTLSLANSEAEAGIRHYSWSTGRTDRSYSHTFNDPGTYTIEGRVVDEEGQEDTDTVTITVEEDDSYEYDGGEDMWEEPEDTEEDTTSDVERYNPQIVGIDDPGTVEIGQSFNIQGEATHRASNPGLQYEWSTGDTGKSATHSFQAEGTQEVTLTVTDSNGDSVQETVQILVEEGTPDSATPPPRPQQPLQIFFDGQIQTAVQTSSFLSFFNVASEPDKVDGNEPVEETLRVQTAVEPEENLGEGRTTKTMATWAIIREGGEVVDRGQWEEVSGEYTHNFDRQFEEDSHYAYIVMMAEAESTYDFQTEEWRSYEVSSLDQSKYQFEVTGSSSGSSGDDTGFTFGDDDEPLPLEFILVILVGLFLVAGTIVAVASRRGE